MTESNAELWSQIAEFESLLYYQLSSVALVKVPSLLVPQCPLCKNGKNTKLTF